MSSPNYIQREVILDHIYKEINKDRETNIPKKVIADIIKSQSAFTLEKIYEGGYEEIIWKGMGRFAVNYKKLKALFKKKKKND